MMLQVKLEKPTEFNSYRWPLTHDKTAIVDLPVPAHLYDYKWVAVCWNFRWYAYSYRKVNGDKSGIAMHRLIANTPPNETTHHLNKNSLDNRQANLLNMTFRDHKQLHGIRRFGRKKKVKTTIEKKTKTT